MSSTVKSYIEQFVAFVKGDDAAVIGAKVQRQANSAFKTQIHSLEGKLVILEDRVTNAEEELVKARLNYGEVLTEEQQEGAYVENILRAQETILKAQKELKAHKETIAFLKEQNSLLD